MPDQPITYMAYPGHTVIIDQQNEGAGFYMMTKSYITISGFEIINARGGGVWTTADRWSSNIIIENNHIHHLNSSPGDNVGAVKIDACDHCIVRNNRLHDVMVGGDLFNQNSAGVHSYDMRYSLIEDNIIWNAGNGVFHKRSYGDKGGVVRGNTIHDVNYGVRYSIGGAGDPKHVDQEVYENILNLYKQVNTSRYSVQINMTHLFLPILPT